MGIEGLITELIHVGRSAVELGLTLASSGNLSARLPAEDRFIITTSGTWLDRLNDNDFVEMTLQGNAANSKPQPSSEWKLHQRTYIERPDVNAVIHVHPQCTIILDALEIPIRLISMDHALYVRSIGRVDYLPSGSDELADSAGAACREHHCVILAFHGFDQELPESLWVGSRESTTLVTRGSAGMSEAAQRLSVLPAGHPQGYQDCFNGFVSDVYAEAAGETREGLPRFEDGLRAAVLTEAVLASSASRSWVEVPA